MNISDPLRSEQYFSVIFITKYQQTLASMRLYSNLKYLRGLNILDIHSIYSLSAVKFHCSYANSTAVCSVTNLKWYWIFYTLFLAYGIWPSVKYGRIVALWKAYVFTVYCNTNNWFFSSLSISRGQEELTASRCYPTALKTSLYSTVYVGYPTELLETLCIC